MADDVTATDCEAPLPERDWEALAESDPWSVIVDALIYQKRSAEAPPALTEAALWAATKLVSLGLHRTNEYTVDEIGDLWVREDWHFDLAFDEDEEAISVRAVFEDGLEPTSASVRAKGVGGAMRARFAEYGATDG